MKLQKNDFVEIEFTGRDKDGEIFDSNLKKVTKDLNPDLDPKPFIFPLGQGMFLKGIDDFLINKGVGKHKIELAPKDAFGVRDSNMIKMIPIKVFHEHKINPEPGATFNFDNKIAKILTVSGGRVMVDFNHPLAGKDVVYDLEVLRHITDENEKIKALNEFLFKKDFKFDIKDKKVTMEVDSKMLKFVEMFKDKFKEILGFDLKVKEAVEKKPETSKHHNNPLG